MAMVKITEKETTAELDAGTHVLVTQDAVTDGQTLHSLRRAPLSVLTEKLEEDFLTKEEAQDITEDVEHIKAYIGYADEDIAGLMVDYKNKRFTRLAGARDKTPGADFDAFPMYGGRKRCIVKDSGEISAYYGETGYTEDGSAGQVMVYQPAFYYKIVPLSLEKNKQSGIGYHLRRACYYVSSEPKAGFKLHPAFYDGEGKPVEYILMSAYEGSMYDTSSGEYVTDGAGTDTEIGEGALLCSAAGLKPISGLKKPLNKVNLESMANNRGDGWHLENIKTIGANQLLMIIELGTMNTQSGIGQGVVSITDNTACNCTGLTGSSATLGNSTGQAASTINEIGGVETVYNTSGKTAVSYRGVENPWGSIWKHINGVNIWGDGKMGGGQPYIAQDFDYSETRHDGNYKPAGFTVSNADGYASAMGYGSPEYDWLFMPSEVEGTSTLPVGDYQWRTPNLNGYKIALFGGSWSSGIIAGGFCWNCSNNVGSHYRYFGGRLMYVPTAASAPTL